MLKGSASQLPCPDSPFADMPSQQSLHLVITAWNNVNQKRIFYTAFNLDILPCTEEEGGGNVVFAGGWGKGVTYLAPIGWFYSIIHFCSLASTAVACFMRAWKPDSPDTSFCFLNS